MADWYIEQVFAARTWKLRREVFSAKGQLSDVMLDGDFEASHFAAYSGDEVVGVLTLQRSLGDYEIRYFAVHPDFRRQGVGTALLHYAVQFVKTFNGCRLSVQTGREQQSFWTKNRFVLMKESDKPERFINNLKKDITA
ncbi:GNAT family N-acetyltransferase [Sphingobacterium sp.]|uniref:GNAT family N-acetyltransferase n=1 Tax=Sphingobacterium sp. TaxID=341027 RepID=UPI0031D07929